MLQQILLNFLNKTFLGYNLLYILIFTFIGYIFSRIVCLIFNETQKTNKKGSNINDEIRAENDEESEDDESLMPSLPEELEHIPLKFERLSIDESLKKSEDFYVLLNSRRSVRHFSQESVPIKIIHNIIKTAGTSPSGAHTEPWTYICVTSMEIKQEIRNIIEKEEEINYKKRMGKVWTTDLKPFKTNWIKEYLTDAPCLILIFKQIYSFKNDRKKRLHYYNEQSVCLSAGILLTAIHNAGLASLVSTPLNCGPAIRNLLGRPSYEKLSLLFPVGYPAENCTVPDLKRKPLEEILIEF